MSQDEPREARATPDSLPQSQAGGSPMLKRDDLVGVMQGYNPWWTAGRANVPPFRRFAYHACRRYLADERLRRAVLLSGPRRVGKTTVLQQIAQASVDEGREPRSICYLTLDNPVLSHVPIQRLLDIYHETVWPQGQPAVLLLDEVQYSEQWDRYLKQLVDHRPEYRIAVTGSASLAHRQRLAESGVGRWITVRVPPLSFYEFLHLRGENLDGVPDDVRPEDLFSPEQGELLLLAPRFRPIMPLFKRYLLLGGFPELARLDDVVECQRLLREDVIDRVLKRDMAVLFNVRNVANLERLFVYICTHSGAIFSATKCADALGSTKPTIGNYLEALEQANLIYLVPPFKRTGKKALKAPPKVYLVDAALRNAVLLKGEEVLSDADEMGRIVETTVLRHLVSRYDVDTPEVSYWRNGSRGREVDFVVRTPKYTIPVEVKYRASSPSVEGSGMAEFCREELVEHGYWVTQAEQDIGLIRVEGSGAKVLRLPAHVFCYLLGQAERMVWA